MSKLRLIPMFFMAMTAAHEAAAQVVIVDDVVPHVRFALGGVGGGFVGDTQGGLGGLHLQAGVQLNRLVAIFYQGQFMGGLFADQGSFFAFNEAMVDFTLWDTLQLGVAPSFDVVTGCQDTTRVGFTRCEHVSFFGADGRIGVVVGSHRHWRRSGLMLGFDVHPTFLDNNEYVTSLLFSISGALY